jgi:hypothetical protein
MSILDMDNSINALEGTVLPVSSDFNFITTEETVVLLILIAEEDEMAASIINIE